MYQQRITPDGPMMTVRHYNARAAAAFTADKLRKGYAVMLFDSHHNRELALAATVPQRADLDGIECGYRAGCWDDADEYAS